MIEMVLPYPPSANRIWRMFRGRMVISREGRAFRGRVCSVLAAMGAQMMTGPLVVEIDLYPPDRRRRDCDNTLKASLDAIQHGGAYEDDSQIWKLTVTRHRPVRGGRMLVRIAQTPSPQDEVGEGPG